MIDIDKLEALVKTVTSGAAAQKSADPVIRNMGRLEFDDACKQYLRATNPAAILALIAEVRALRDDAEPSEQMIRAALAIQWPALYRDGLYSEHDGAKLRAETDKRIETVRQQYIAMRAARGAK
jgi:hypothetical protein